MEWLGLASSPDDLQLHDTTPIRKGSDLTIGYYLLCITTYRYMLAGVIHTSPPCILLFKGPGVFSCLLEGKESVRPSPSCTLAEVMLAQDILALIALAQEVFVLWHIDHHLLVLSQEKETGRRARFGTTLICGATIRCETA